jgi:hypothetical protein
MGYTHKTKMGIAMKIWMLVAALLLSSTVMAAPPSKYDHCKDVAYAANLVAYLRDKNMPMATAYSQLRAQTPKSEASDKAVREMVKSVYLDEILQATPYQSISDYMMQVCMGK